jgi:hypothetical protein
VSIICDASGQALGCFHFDDEPQRRAATNKLITIKVVHHVFRNIAYGDGATAMRVPRILKQSR